MKSFFARGKRVFCVLTCLVFLGQAFLLSPAKSASGEFPLAVVLWRYDTFNDTHWTVYNQTVQQLRNEGFDALGDVNQLVQANYTYLNYTLKSKVVGLSWPNVVVRITQGRYNLDLTAYKVLGNGSIGGLEGIFSSNNFPAALGNPLTYSEPDVGVGFDPSVFTIGNTFVASNQTYTVDRKEILNGTFWGQNETYVCVARLVNATHDYSWTSWCDASSGLFLKNVAESRTPAFTSYEEQELIGTGVESDRFDVVQNGQAYVVLVHTNSTLNDFEFDSSANVLTLAVYGPNGTSGTCNITIPKALVPAGNSFEVYVDGQKTNGTLAEDASNYYVAVNYQHSAHTITVDIVGGSILPAWWIWAVAAVIIGVLAGTIYFSRIRHHRRHRRTRS